MKIAGCAYIGKQHEQLLVSVQRRRQQQQQTNAEISVVAGLQDSNSGPQGTHWKDLAKTAYFQ